MPAELGESDPRPRLLAPDEPRPWHIEQAAGRSPYVLIADHAGLAIPRRLGGLGLSDAVLRRHIGWDIGIADVSRGLARALDAALVMQPYSRLVIDCNRPPHSPESIPERSERTMIPGNAGLDPLQRAQRRREIFEPYHARIRQLLDERRGRGQPSLLLAMHSFTPVYLDQPRPWHAGVLYGEDGRLACALAAALGADDAALVIGNNQPYALEPEFDYSVPEHAVRRGLPYVELEIRQDLIDTPEGQQRWVQRLARLLPDMAAAFVT